MKIEPLFGDPPPAQAHPLAEFRIIRQLPYRFVKCLVVTRWQQQTALAMPINHAFGARWQRWLVARRSLIAPEDPRSAAYFLAFAPAATSLATLAGVIGERWGIECALEVAKGEVELDHYEVRSWHGWHRHVTLALRAHAFLAVTRADSREPIPLAPVAGAGKKGGPAPGSLAAFRRRPGRWSA